MRVVLERLRDRAVGLRQGPLGRVRAASASGRASAATRNPCASAPSGNEPASQPAHTTPPAPAEKAPRCSRSPHDAHDGELGREPGGQQQLQAEGERLRAAAARRLARRAARARGRAGCRRAGSARRVEQAQHRLAGLGGALERRAARAAPAWAWTVSAGVTVHSSPRPSCSTSRRGRAARAGRRSATSAAARPWRPRRSARARACRGAGCGRPRRSGSSAGRSLRS